MLSLALRAGGMYLPIFTRDNFTCFLFKVQYEGADFWEAMNECIASDGRATTSPTGVNPTVDEINVLSIRVSQEFVDSL